MKNTLPLLIISFMLTVVLSRCQEGGGLRPSISKTKTMKDSILSMTDSLTNDLAKKGAIAWVDYFENTPHFNMIVQGQKQFPDYQTFSQAAATGMLRSFGKPVLHFSNLQVDSLSDQTAAVVSAYTETITDSAGNPLHIAGYLSGLLDQTACGWKWRSLHWSIKQ